MSFRKEKNPPAFSDDGNIHADVEAVMKKYDRESNTRIWEGTPKLLIRILMAIFSLYCIGVTLFEFLVVLD